MDFPSDFPAKALEAVPITFPKSFRDSAPTSVIIFLISASNSSAES